LGGLRRPPKAGILTASHLKGLISCDNTPERSGSVPAMKKQIPISSPPIHCAKCKNDGQRYFHNGPFAGNLVERYSISLSKSHIKSLCLGSELALATAPQPISLFAQSCQQLCFEIVHELDDILLYSGSQIPAGGRDNG